MNSWTKNWLNATTSTEVVILLAARKHPRLPLWAASRGNDVARGCFQQST
jgi:hypothetical protein